MTRASLRAMALAGAVVLAGSIAAVAYPHTELKRSEPARDSRLTVPPLRIELWFTAKPQLAFSRIRLVGPAGDVALGKLVADTVDAFRADILAPVAAGDYRVVWQTASADGHHISGEFGFTVASPSTIAEADTGRRQPAAVIHTHAARTPSPAENVARWWEFGALLTVLGVLAFLHGVLPPLASRGVHTEDASRHARGAGEIAAVIYICSAVFRLLMESSIAQNEALGGPGLATIVLGSSWGHGWLFGMIGAVLVLPGFILSRRHVAVGTPIALTGALAMVLSPALSGHAATANWFVASVALDAMHVASIGAWVGGLLVVVVVGIPAMARLTDGNPDAAVSALVNSFHPLALLCAPLAILTGAGSSVLRLGSLTALTTTGYGRVLVVKVSLALAVVGMGAYNSMRARRRLGTPAGTQSLRRSATVELVLASLVLAVSTILTSSAVPSEMAP
jgi:copper transport protein